MPYKIARIGETPFYHVINKNTGHIYSHVPLTYDRALGQLRALYVHAPPLSLDKSSGGKIAFTLSLRDKPPPSVRKIVDDYGGYLVKSVYVCREPIAQAFDLTLTALTLGKFKDDRKKYNIDKFFHLYTIFTLVNDKNETVYIRLEKNEVINAKVLTSIPTGLDGMTYLPTRVMTFKDVFTATEGIMGHDRFIHYSIYTSNCQDFALALAQAVLGGNMSSELTKFIKQEHIEDLVPKKSFTGKVAEKITKWAGIFDHIFHGSGVVCQYCTPSVMAGSLPTSAPAPKVDWGKYWVEKAQERNKSPEFIASQKAYKENPENKKLLAEWKAKHQPKKKSNPFSILKYA